MGADYWCLFLTYITSLKLATVGVFICTTETGNLYNLRSPSLPREPAATPSPAHRWVKAVPCEGAAGGKPGGIATPSGIGDFKTHRFYLECRMGQGAEDGWREMGAGGPGSTAHSPHSTGFELWEDEERL